MKIVCPERAAYAGLGSRHGAGGGRVVAHASAVGLTRWRRPPRRRAGVASISVPRTAERRTRSALHAGLAHRLPNDVVTMGPGAPGLDHLRVVVLCGAEVQGDWF